MSDTPSGQGSTWVDLARDFHNSGPTTPVPFAAEHDYIKMLKEAQRENSARSSTKVSPISSAIISTRNSPTASPKSPPNSPNVGLADYKDLKEQLKSQGIFINKEPEPTMDDILSSTDWTSRPNMLPPRNWRLAATVTGGGGQSVSSTRVGGKDSWNNSKQLLLTILGTNTLSLTIGLGIGYWLFSRSSS